MFNICQECHEAGATQKVSTGHCPACRQPIERKVCEACYVKLAVDDLVADFEKRLSADTGKQNSRKETPHG